MFRVALDFEFLLQNYYEMKLEMHGFQCHFPIDTSLKLPDSDLMTIFSVDFCFHNVVLRAFFVLKFSVSLFFVAYIGKSST